MMNAVKSQDHQTFLNVLVWQIIDDGSANALHGNYWKKSKEVSMGDAYRTLVKTISQGDVPLRLEITAERDLVSEGRSAVIKWVDGTGFALANYIISFL